MPRESGASSTPRFFDQVSAAEFTGSPAFAGDDTGACDYLPNASTCRPSRRRTIQNSSTVSKTGEIMMSRDPVELSKFLSFVLRHKPDAIGLTLDPQGWVSIDELVTKGNAAGTLFNRDDLLLVVETNDKKRFSVSADGLSIRAAQGHSVSVELGLSSREPPPVLYHGTATRFVGSILSQGLKPQKRQQVHLSVDRDTAQRVGQRHGTPVIFKIDALQMHRLGFKFYVADNGVWLTDQVPPEFLALPSGSADPMKTLSPERQHVQAEAPPHDPE
jgi:putative RNA 2'-phosphotransferase